MNRDIYADLLKYGLTKYKTSMELIFASFTDRGDSFSPSDISRFGFLLSQVICFLCDFDLVPSNPYILAEKITRFFFADDREYRQQK